MKYAMIPINRRYNDKDERLIRRVLISYKRIRKGVYIKTKLIAKDAYFDNPFSSQQYVFTDDYFYLKSNKYNDTIIQNSLINQKRRYQRDAGLLYETAIEFKADTDQLAKQIFEGRNELH